MLGYVQKDKGLAHYRPWFKKISNQELRDGRKAYAVVRLSPTDGEMGLVNNNIARYIFQFWEQHCKPLRPPVKYLLLWMLRSGKYAASASCCVTGQGQGLNEARLTALWSTYIDHENTTIEDAGCSFLSSERDRARTQYVCTMHI